METRESVTTTQRPLGCSTICYISGSMDVFSKTLLSKYDIKSVSWLGFKVSHGSCHLFVVSPQLQPGFLQFEQIWKFWSKYLPRWLAVKKIRFQNPLHGTVGEATVHFC